MLELLILAIQLLWLVGLSHRLIALAERFGLRPRSNFEWLVVFSVSLGFCGYLVFWIYAIARPVGWAISLCSFGISLAPAWKWMRSLKGAKTPKVLSPDWVFVFLALAGSMYFLFPSIVHYRPENLMDWISNYYFNLSNDNVIPRFHAEIVRAGQPLVQPDAAWQVSDRTPLLSGIYLLMSFFTDTKTYQATGTLIQLLFFVSALHFAESCGFKGRARFYLLLALVFNGFFHHGAIFLWPKLQATHFGILGLLLLVKDDISFSAGQKWGVAGFCFVLAYLSHPGVVFSAPLLLPFALAALARLRRERSRWFVPLIPGAVFFASWLVYQKLIDPPGDRLLKWHLAGVTDVSREPLLALIRKGYSEIGWTGALHARWENLKYQFFPETDLSTFRLWRRSEFIHILQTFGIWWIGLLGLPSLWKRRAQLHLNWLVVGTFAAQALWLAAIFLPAMAPNHANSYLTVAMIGMLLLLALAEIGENWLAIISVVSASYFLVVWVGLGARDQVLAGHSLNYGATVALVVVSFVYLQWTWKTLVRQAS